MFSYTYWEIRPCQEDPTITVPVGVPNFPSYSSGHSTFSGAAAQVLSYIFPSETNNVQGMANQASMSRVYAGIHYPFDCNEGLILGREIGQLAVQKAEADGAP